VLVAVDRQPGEGWLRVSAVQNLNILLGLDERTGLL
jgi:hypothetical protein